MRESCVTRRTSDDDNRGDEMRKGLPSSGALCSGFGRRATLALHFQALRRGEQRSKAEVGREFRALTGDTVQDATVSRWFLGQFWPADPRHQLAFARILEVDPGWLFFGEHSQAPGIELEDAVTTAATSRTRR